MRIVSAGRYRFGQLPAGVRRSAVAVLAATVVSGGAVVPAGAITAQPGTQSRRAAGTVLPGPGPLLRAPRSLAAAEAEIGPVLAQAEHPKTALVGTVRLLVNRTVNETWQIATPAMP